MVPTLDKGLRNHERGTDTQNDFKQDMNEMALRSILGMHKDSMLHSTSSWRIGGDL